LQIVFVGTPNEAAGSGSVSNLAVIRVNHNRSGAIIAESCKENLDRSLKALIVPAVTVVDAASQPAGLHVGSNVNDHDDHLMVSVMMLFLSLLAVMLPRGCFVVPFDGRYGASAARV
jgi:hypothetical protein